LKNGSLGGYTKAIVLRFAVASAVVLAAFARPVAAQDAQPAGDTAVSAQPAGNPAPGAQPDAAPASAPAAGDVQATQGAQAPADAAHGQGVQTAGDPAEAAKAAMGQAGMTQAAIEAPKIVPPATAKTTKRRAKTKKRNTAAGRKKKREPESKYKSRVLTDGMESVYRFDENGDPIVAKKSVGSKAKKSSEAAPAKGACTADAPCVDKMGSDADAL
jgi:hypothetical protein